jgi:hypothetical protein
LRITIRAVAVAARLEPPEVLRAQLQDARARDIDWDEAWRQATARALAGTRGEDRKAWVAALSWSWPYWRAAYLGVQFDRCDRPIYPI